MSMTIAEAKHLHPLAFAAVEKRIREWQSEIDDKPDAAPVGASVAMLEGVLSLVIHCMTTFANDDGAPVCVAFTAPILAGQSIH